MRFGIFLLGGTGLEQGGCQRQLHSADIVFPWALQAYVQLITMALPTHRHMGNSRIGLTAYVLNVKWGMQWE